MKTSRMFYLVPPSMIQRAMLNEKNSTDSEPADVKLKRMVQQVGEAKIEEKNAGDESWKNLGENKHLLILRFGRQQDNRPNHRRTRRSLQR